MRHRGKAFLMFVCLLIFICSTVFSQSKETGAIQGTVTTPEGEVLPGVEVTISSPSLIGGSQSSITNVYGRYRFVALPIGIYAAETRLQGFNPQRKVGLRLSVQMTLTIDFVLTVGTLEEVIEVVGEAPMIDVKDSQLGTATYEKEFLTHLPSSRSIRTQMKFAPSSMGERYAVPYGSSESLSSNFLLDGVKINSPEAGEPEVNLDYDSVEEMKMMGQGTNAEYGGFSGIVVSTITKSGGNNLEGLLTFWLQLPSFHSKNWEGFSGEQKEELAQRAWRDSYDFHLNVGGPFIKDKLWWYSSFKFYHSTRHIDDYEDYGLSKDDFEYNWNTRLLGKLTWQMDPTNRIFGAFDWAVRRDENLDAGPWTSPEAVGREIGHQIYFNLNYLHIFSDTTFLEAKFGGYDQKGKMDIDYDVPMRYDEFYGILSGNFWEIWEVPRTRFQVNAAVSHHAEEFAGTHDFKFGGEFEYSHMKNYRGYPGGKGYFDWMGEPYLMVEYGPYLIEPTSVRVSLFVQDQWTVSDRLTINPGFRLNIWRGSVPDHGTIFKPQLGWAPRLGITFDLFGDHTTALKFHYGKYYHGLMGMFYGHWKDQFPYAEYLHGAGLNAIEEWLFAEEGEPFSDDYPYPEEWWLDFREEVATGYEIDPNLRFPYLHNVVAGIERQLGSDISVGVSFIYREHRDFFDNVNISGMWVPIQWTDPWLGQTHNVFQRLNPGDNQIYVTNPKKGEDYGQAFADIVPFTPSRKYRGVEFTFRKRFSNRWQLHASYTYSRAWGSDDNSWGEYEDNRTSSLGASVLFLNPNWSYNAEGTLTRDHPHIFKIMGSVVLPLDITLGAFFSYSSGMTYNHNIRLDRDIDPDRVGLYAGSLRIYGEEKGSYRYPGIPTLDLRLEKFFRLGGMRIGLLMDMFNVLNDDTVEEYETYVEDDAFEWGEFIWSIVPPRTWRFGIHIEF